MEEFQDYETNENKDADADNKDADADNKDADADADNSVKLGQQPYLTLKQFS